MGFTVQGPMIWIGLIGGVAGIFYELGVMIRLIKYRIAGKRRTAFVQSLDTVKVGNVDKTVLRMEYYGEDGEKITGVQEDFVSLEKPLTAEAKYKPGESYDIIYGGKFKGRYVLVHRFMSSLGAAVAGMVGCAVLAVVMAKLCIFGFSF